MDGTELTDFNESQTNTSFTRLKTKEDSLNEEEEEKHFHKNSKEELFISTEKKEQKLSKSKQTQNSKNSQKIQSNSFFFRKIGNTFSFFGNNHGDPIIMIGPHWYLYLIVSILISIGTFFYIRFYWNFITNLSKIILSFFYFVFFFSYSYTAIINPGYPKHENQPQVDEEKYQYFYCSKCKLWTPKKIQTQHCQTCDICVEGYDHHCPWVSGCVGVKNLLSFYIFIGSLFSGLVVYIFITEVNLSPNVIKKILTQFSE